MSLPVEVRPSASKALAALPRAVFRRLDAAILALADDPYPPGSRKLEGRAGLYRVRVGDYRIVYRVKADRLVLVIVRIGHRREVYRSL